MVLTIWWNGTDNSKQNYSESNKSQCHFVHHKSRKLAWNKTKASAPTAVTDRTTSWKCRRKGKTRGKVGHAIISGTAETAPLRMFPAFPDRPYDTAPKSYLNT